MSALKSKVYVYFWYYLSKILYIICLWMTFLLACPFIVIGKFVEPWANNWKFRLMLWKDLKRKENDAKRTKL